MAFQRFEVELKGTSGLLLQNPCTIDSLGKPSQVLSWYHRIPQSKRDVRIERAMRDYHWLFSCHWGTEGSFEHPEDNDGECVFSGFADPVLPAANLQRCLRDAATAWKRGKDVGRSTIVENDSLIDYEGPKDAVAMLQDGRFYHSARNKRGSMAIRVHFPTWKVRFRVLLNPDIMVASEFGKILSRAGAAEGLGSWRPGSDKGGSYGRFLVSSLQEIPFDPENKETK